MVCSPLLTKQFCPQPAFTETCALLCFLILTTSAQPLLPSTKVGCSKGRIHVHGKGLIITCNRELERLGEGGGGTERCGG